MGYAFNDAMSMYAISTNPICKPHSMHAINTVQIGIIPNCPKLSQNGGVEKVSQTVPTGRVIKYPKKCALFSPPGGPGGPKMHPPENPPE